ncbi:MAG: CCA tRNA nucleotidyltransferase [Pirellula sp.]
MRKLHWEDESGLYRFSTDVVRTLQSHGYTAYFAGGCVRDALMGNMPSDYDVATNATLDQVQSLFGPKQTKIIGAAFGVACVTGKVDKQRFEVEVATFRSDGSYSDGRRPDWVRFTGPEEDAQRRDFSINGIFFDPVAEVLHDFVGGEEDLKRGVIRAIGNPEKRIDEDKLRMLRAVRFAARFGFQIDPETSTAIRTHANEIAIVSGERISAEFRKFVETKHLVYGLEQTFHVGLLQFLIPEVPVSCADRFTMERAFKVISALGSHIGFTSLLASLFWTADCKGEEAAIAIGNCRDRWKLSNLEHDEILFAIRAFDTLIHADSLPWSVTQPLLISPHVKVAYDLAMAVAIADELSLDGLSKCRKASEWEPEKLNPAPLLTGNDLQKLGLSPGPAFAQILKTLRAKQLDREIETTEDAKQWIRTSALSIID